MGHDGRDTWGSLLGSRMGVCTAKSCFGEMTTGDSGEKMEKNALAKRLSGPEARAGMEWHTLVTSAHLGVLGVPTSLVLVALTGLGQLRLILLSQNLPSTRRPPQMS